MTQYYRIQPEQDNYRRFELDAFDFLAKAGEESELSDFATPMHHAWQPIKGRCLHRIDATLVPDISTWQADLLIRNQKTYDGLKDILESYDELLPAQRVGTPARCCD